MTVVLLVTAGVLFWRVEYALDRQLDQDLAAYQRVVQRSVVSGAALTARTPGQRFQVYARDGAVVGGNASGRLVDRETVAAAVANGEQRQDVGHVFPPAPHPYRVAATPVQAGSGVVVVASAISKSTHDEALRELLLQLGLADLATLAAAAVVGYGTARAALDPVERYRVAAERAGAANDVLLPVAVGRDDELSRLGDTFNGLLGRIARANERERQFLGDASHELRSPLALMRTELEWALVRLDEDPEQTTTTLTSLQAQVERLISLSNALLDLEEVRAASDPPRDHVDVDGLLAEVVTSFAARARAQDRRITVSSPEDLVTTGNLHWLELAVGNLVSNALRHGAGTVAIAASTDGTGTRITVGDDGPGFPADFAPRAFDRFSRAEPSRSTPGTGLGLALVAAVAEAHGGRAHLHGATVSILWPHDPGPSAQPAPGGTA